MMVESDTGLIAFAYRFQRSDVVLYAFAPVELQANIQIRVHYSRLWRIYRVESS